MAALLLGLALVLRSEAHEALEQRFSDLFAQVAKSPRDASLFYQLADLHVQHEDWAAALAAVAVVERLAPGEYATEPLRGQALALAGDPQRARQAYDRFLQQHPESGRVLILRAHLRQQQGDAMGGIEDLLAAVSKTEKPEPDLVLELGNALFAQQRIDEAILQMDEGLRRLGALPALVQRVIAMEVEAGRLEAALQRIGAMEQSALRAEPWIAERARLYARAGRPMEARATWGALLERLKSAPATVRASHAMSLLAEQARQGLTAP